MDRYAVSRTASDTVTWYDYDFSNGTDGWTATGTGPDNFTATSCGDHSIIGGPRVAGAGAVLQRVLTLPEHDRLMLQISIIAGKNPGGGVFFAAALMFVYGGV